MNEMNKECDVCMLSIERLMMMSMEDVNAEEARLNKMLVEEDTQKEAMRKKYDLSSVSYDSDIWMMYEEILYDINYIERELEVIEDYRKYYDYYWDMI